MTDFDSRKGNIVIGGMLVFVGLALTLDRAGLIEWSGQWSLWPLILGGIGLALFVQSPPGGPKRGLVFMTGGAWLFATDAGWVSLEDSWPVVVIVVGLIIALNGGRRRHWAAPDLPGIPGIPGAPGDPAQEARLRRRHHRSLTPLAVIGIWIAIFVALQVSGVRSSFTNSASSVTTSSSSGRVQLVSVMGRSEHISTATAFRGADVTNIMGRSDIDLRAATLAPGATASVQLFSMMGSVVLRVPPGWTVDSGAISAMGGVRDERFPVSSNDPPAPGPAPRLVLRGLVAMGRLSIR
jgi:hypothetical protein